MFPRRQRDKWRFGHGSLCHEGSKKGLARYQGPTARLSGSRGSARPVQTYVPRPLSNRKLTNTQRRVSSKSPDNRLSGNI